jgi:hypothetical protein
VVDVARILSFEGPWNNIDIEIYNNSFAKGRVREQLPTLKLPGSCISHIFDCDEPFAALLVWVAPQTTLPLRETRDGWSLHQRPGKLDKSCICRKFDAPVKHSLSSNICVA